MRTTVDIDLHLLDQLRDQAQEEGVPFNKVLNRVLQRGLAAEPPRPAPYECLTFRLGVPLQPLDKALALADALEQEETTRKLAQRE